MLDSDAGFRHPDAEGASERRKEASSFLRCYRVESRESIEGAVVCDVIDQQEDEPGKSIEGWTSCCDHGRMRLSIVGFRCSVFYSTFRVW